MSEMASRAQQQKPRELIHEILSVGMLHCNCHIVGDPVTRQAIVIDPGDDVTRILESLGRHRLTLRAIVITHAHIDHVGGLATLRNSTGAPVMMHQADLKLYDLLPTQASWLGVRTPPRCEVDQFLREGGAVRWGATESTDGFALQVLHTPGHSEGSVSLYLPRHIPEGATEPGLLFAGDTLFAGSIGRTDLWGGSMEQIMDSIRGKLLELPDDTIVLPGHGETTTIGAERETNPFL